jgi:hypothetical protein
MPQVPDDLVLLSEVIAAYPEIKAQWWYTQTSRGKLTTYRKPGYKGVFVSQSAANDLTVIRPNNESEDERAM